MGINGCIYFFLLEEGDWVDREQGWKGRRFKIIFFLIF